MFMGDVIKGRFPRKEGPDRTDKKRQPDRTGNNDEIRQFDVDLSRKQSEMLVYFSMLTKSDSSASYDRQASLLRQSTLKDWKDEDLKQKMLDGYAVVWKADPHWYYALEQELVDRGFLQAWR